MSEKRYSVSTRYVTFTSANVNVDLNKFLDSDAGKALIKKASKHPKDVSGKSKEEVHPARHVGVKGKLAVA